MSDEKIPQVAWMAFFALGPGKDLVDTFPAVGDGSCCWGATIRGPAACTCWEPVFDVEQQPVNEIAAHLINAGVRSVIRRRMCHDCAYRPDSPEKTDDPSYNGDAEFLERIARDAERFWCHQGMRIPSKWVHPSGVEIPGSPGGYTPPRVDGVPFKADGRPAELCAGWDARRRALAATSETRR